MQLTTHFHRNEFRCPCNDRGMATGPSWCGGDVWVHMELVSRLQRVRDSLGVPVVISSGCRCPRYNHEGLFRTQGRPGARRSQHKRGTAADIYAPDVSHEDVAKAAEDHGLYVIRYPTFTHVDIRDYI